MRYPFISVIIVFITVISLSRGDELPDIAWELTKDSHGEGFGMFQFHPDGNTFFVVDPKKKCVEERNVSDGSFIRDFPYPGVLDDFESISFEVSNNGKWLMFPGAINDTIHLVSLEDPGVKKYFTFQEGSRFTGKFNYDGKYLFACCKTGNYTAYDESCGENNLMVFDIDSEEVIYKREYNLDYFGKPNFYQFRFSPNNSKILFTAMSLDIDYHSYWSFSQKIMEMNYWENISRFSGLVFYGSNPYVGNNINTWEVQFTPDGKRIFQATSTYLIVYFDAYTLEKLDSIYFGGELASCRYMCFSMDSKFCLVSSYEDKVCKLYVIDIENEEEIRIYEFPDLGYFQVSPDNKYILCQSYKKLTLLNAKWFADPVGIDDNKLAEFSVFPNPAGSKVHINFDRSSNIPAKIQLLDINSNIILEKEISSGIRADLNTSGIANGMYFLRVIRGTDSRVEKLVILK